MKLHIVGRVADSLGDEEPAVAGIAIGRNLAALVVAHAQLNRSAVPASSASVLLVAENDQRLCAVIRNEGSTPLHITQPVSPYSSAAPESDTVPPGAEWDSDEAVLGAIYGWWDTANGGGAPTGNAVVTEIVPFLGPL